MPDILAGWIACFHLFPVPDQFSQNYPSLHTYPIPKQQGNHLEGAHTFTRGHEHTEHARTCYMGPEPKNKTDLARSCTTVFSFKPTKLYTGDTYFLISFSAFMLFAAVCGTSFLSFSAVFCSFVKTVRVTAPSRAYLLLLSISPDSIRDSQRESASFPLP